MLGEVSTNGYTSALVFVFLMSNIVLLNLLIAMMSNTYDKCKASAKRRRLLDFYAFSQKYRRVAMMSVIPLNIILYLWNMFKFLVIYQTTLKRDVITRF